MMRLALACLLLASPAAAASLRVAPTVRAPFVPGYVGSLKMSLGADAFYASRFMGSFTEHLKTIGPMRDSAQVAAYLQAEISADGGSVAGVADALGREAMTPRTASAVLLANALVRPDQAETVLVEMEKIVPAWGQRAAHAIDETGRLPGVSPDFARLLGRAARAVRPAPIPGTYDSRGRLNGLFDGSRG